MSTFKSFLRSGTFVAASAAALTLTACASNSDGARYGNVYDYESNSTCESSNHCGTQTVSNESDRYGETAHTGGSYSGATGTENVIYADCSVISGMNCNAQPAQTHTVHTASQQDVYPVQTYPAAHTVSDMSYGSSMAEAAPCPSGTVSNGDGTCMESSYAAPTTSYSQSSYSGASSSLPAQCPSGTTMQGDGTCMEASYSSMAATSSYGVSSSSVSSYGTSSAGTAACPAGSSAQGDGTCAMNEGTAYSPTSSFGGYTNSGSYTTQDYAPIRK